MILRTEARKRGSLRSGYDQSTTLTHRRTRNSHGIRIFVEEHLYRKTLNPVDARRPRPSGRFSAGPEWNSERDSTEQLVRVAGRRPA